MPDSIEHKQVKRTMTDKQKVARLANLERGRKKRLESLQQKKESKARGKEEYDLSSDYSDSLESDSESDNDAFVISKKKKTPKIKEREVKSKKPPRFAVMEKTHSRDHLRTDVDDLKYMVMELAKLQKKQNKTTQKQSRKKSGGTKIVVLPQNTSGIVPTKSPNDSLMEALRKSLM
jgi:hypothetical protein